MRKDSIVFFLLLTITLFAGCGQSASQPAPMNSQPSGQPMVKQNYTDITPQEAKKLIDENPGMTVIIDVSPYYTDGHLPGAIHLQLGKMLDMAIPTLNKDKNYLVYCHGDGPSMAGAQKLVDAGFKMVYRLKDNYGGWVAAGYPIEK